MYVPPAFAGPDLDQVATFVENVGAADFVTFDGRRLVSSLLPVIWDRAAGEHGLLLAHLAVANPQWRSVAPDVHGLAIVHGPQAYVSPSWYPSKREHGRVVPTWNYSTVHFTGPITFHTDVEWLRDIVTRLTDLHETGRTDRWHVDDAPGAYIDGLLRGIVGVEMRVISIEAKDKLSQNRNDADQGGVIEGLSHEPGPHSRAVAAVMRARHT
jgi:transcriptional regulator